jgi:hypothetical protein
MATPTLRAAPIPDPGPRTDDIEFLHPGYDFPVNRILSLPRFDPIPGSSPVLYGVHNRTALIACQIIGNNAFESGYLALDREDTQRVNVPPDGILTADSYYFIVGNGLSMHTSMYE